MKPIKIVSALILMSAFYSCQFQQSVNKDLTTGAYSRGDGLACDDVIIDISGKAENRNEFVFGEKVNLIFNNVSGLTSLDNKTYPGLSMHIVKNEQDTVLSYPDLLKDLNEGTTLSPLQLQANFRAALPYQNNESYKIYVEIWDKKGDGKFNYELPFIIKENNLLDIKSNGITYSDIYLWNETQKQPVSQKEVSMDDLYILILNDVKGLEISNDKVFPIFSLEIIDKNGNELLSSPNLLSAYEEEGVSPEDLKNQLTAKITFTKGALTNPCKLHAKLKDKNSSKEIAIETELNIN